MAAEVYEADAGRDRQVRRAETLADFAIILRAKGIQIRAFIFLIKMVVFIWGFAVVGVVL